MDSTRFSKQWFPRSAVWPLLSCLLIAGAANAGTLVITVNATITSAFGDLALPLAVNDPVSAQFQIDDSVLGAFTPSANPTFSRNEMLYVGAMTQTDLTLDGSPISGSGGDVLLRDSGGNLAGDDTFEITANTNVGSVAGIAMDSTEFILEYDFGAFTLTAGDPLSAPLPLDPTGFNTLQFTSASGGSATASIDNFQVSAPSAVPSTSPLALVVIAASLTLMGVRRVAFSGKAAASVAVLLLVTVGTLAAPRDARALVFVVNSVGDASDLAGSNGDGLCATGVLVFLPGPFILEAECTLRAAIEEANAFPGRDQIHFTRNNIFDTPDGTATLVVPAALPQIVDPVDLDATTATGFLAAGSPRVLLQNAGLSNGLDLEAGALDSTIRGLAFLGFANGVDLDGTNGVWIDACEFGYFAPTTPDQGTIDRNFNAIYISSTTTNTDIGKRIENLEFVGTGNTISGNVYGIVIYGENTSIVGNQIGTDRTGTRIDTLSGSPLGNSAIGINVYSGETTWIGRSIFEVSGGFPPTLTYQGSLGNVISGNGSDGIAITNFLGSTGSGRVIILSNRIGTDLLGETALPNGGDGIGIYWMETQVKIGSDQADPNIISGNLGDGIRLSSAPTEPLDVIRNHIGLDASGLIPIPNGQNGVVVSNTGPIHILSNRIGGNVEAGISISDEPLSTTTADLTIDANWIGANPSGILFGNAGPGIEILTGSSFATPVISNNIVGGNSVGIHFGSETEGLLVTGNFVGTNAAEDNLGNLDAGIISASTGTIDLGVPGDGNIVGWNGGSGILIERSDTGGTRLAGNFIGLAPSGAIISNGLNGIDVQRNADLVAWGYGVVIGSDLDAEPNELAASANHIGQNGLDEISIEEVSSVVVRGNQITDTINFNAANRAIDLDTVNSVGLIDSGDFDEGPNRRQNAPSINEFASSLNGATGDLVLEYRIDTDPTSTTYPLLVDFYLADSSALHPDQYLGSDTYSAAWANLSKTVTIAPVIPVPPGIQHIVAIVTDREENSSEVASAIAVPEPGLELGLILGCLLIGGSGRVRWTRPGSITSGPSCRS